VNQLVRCPSSNPCLQVLVIDDHPASRLLLDHQLQLLGYPARLEATAAGGWQAWLAHTWEVVILDCNLQDDMDGYRLCRAMREHETTTGRARCCILGYTASVASDERHRCHEAGMDDCLFKPVGLQTLGQQLAKGPAWQAAVFDAAALDPLTGEDPVLLEKLLAEILRSCRADRASLLESSVAQPKQLQALAHRIRGAARMICAYPLTTACERLETSRPVPHCPELAQRRLELIDALDRLEQALLQASPTLLANP
jgi:two-component system sensor histidine kinase EvgS